jgi:hypothetical protein
MSSILSEGVELGVLRDNPAARLKLASQPRHTMVVLTAQEVRALAEATAQRSGRPADGLAVLTAAYTGLREASSGRCRRRTYRRRRHAAPPAGPPHPHHGQRHAGLPARDQDGQRPRREPARLPGPRPTAPHPTPPANGPDLPGPRGWPGTPRVVHGPRVPPGGQGPARNPSPPKDAGPPGAASPPGRAQSPASEQARPALARPAPHLCVPAHQQRGQHHARQPAPWPRQRPHDARSLRAPVPSEEQALAVQLDQAHAQPAQPQLHAVDGQDTVTS